MDIVEWGFLSHLSSLRNCTKQLKEQNKHINEHMLFGFSDRAFVSMSSAPGRNPDILLLDLDL
jgi:hypothetical protein